MMFDDVLVVDWSAGADRGPRPVADAIWACHAGADPVYLRNRDIAFAYLEAGIARALDRGQRLFAGFDFPFGYPRGFAAAVTGRSDPFALWSVFGSELRDHPKGNNRFELAGRLNRLFPGTGPFWFNGTAREIPELPRRGRDRGGHGLPERRAVEVLLSGAFSCWQMGGAGAVGGQVMTGLAVLHRLRARFPGQIAVWPFEPLDALVVLVEVWPSLIDAAIRALQEPGEIKDRAQVRVLARAIAGLDPGTMDGCLADVPQIARQEEGWIFAARQPERLLEGLR